MVSTCVFTVTVNDTEPPVLSCINATVALDASGNASIVATDILSGAPADNCSIATVALSRSSFTCADQGSVTVIVTATDGSGNVSTCNAVVTITDPFPASLSAGPDDEICITSPAYTITGATAVNMSLLWTTSGSGTFSVPTALNPVYTRGAADLTSVTLTLTGIKVSGCPVTLSDAMTLSFAGLPVANAGADRDLCSGTASVTLADAAATNGTVAWTTSGNGTFSDPLAANPVYTFGSSDTGPVTLTLTVTSPECGTSADNVVVTFTSAPMSDAGPDAATCSSAIGYQVAGASHAGGTVTWITGGNGTFDNAAVDNPYYTFGSADYASGSVTLTMEVAGGGTCGTVTSNAVITINPLPVIQITDLENISCAGLTDGEVHLASSAGLAPYMYSLMR
ncbi:MAG: hypothetical protein U5L72_15235 [Bacteroidales bacterium]|nr:hypothetical protein [Bacteroidales bacterium]